MLIRERGLLAPPPTRVRSKCPAIILAVRRTVKVRGRIIELISSIITRIGSRGAGAPLGTKWVAQDMGCFIRARIICPAHRGKARLRLILAWLEGVKTNGTNPEILNKIITQKRERLTRVIL